MKRAFLIAVAAIGATGAMVGAASADGPPYTFPYTTASDTYALTPAVTPFRSGTTTDPQPADTTFVYDVDTTPSGGRPGMTQKISAVFQGMSERDTSFASCPFATLAQSGPSACPKGSQVGTGYTVFEEGPSDATNQNNDIYCSVDTSLFNLGGHHLAVYIVEGQGQGDYDACTLPGHLPVTVFANLAQQTISGSPYLVLSYSLPDQVIHPATDTDASIIHDQWEIPTDTTAVTTSKTVSYKVTVIRTKQVTKLVGSGKHRHRVTVTVKYHVTVTRTKRVQTTTRIGFFNTTSCPSSGQRTVGGGFQESDGTFHSVTTTVPCG